MNFVVSRGGPFGLGGGGVQGHGRCLAIDRRWSSPSRIALAFHRDVMSHAAESKVYGYSKSNFKAEPPTHPRLSAQEPKLILRFKCQETKVLHIEATLSVAPKEVKVHKRYGGSGDTRCPTRPSRRHEPPPHAVHADHQGAVKCAIPRTKWTAPEFQPPFVDREMVVAVMSYGPSVGCWSLSLLSGLRTVTWMVVPGSWGLQAAGCSRARWNCAGGERQQ